MTKVIRSVKARRVGLFITGAGFRVVSFGWHPPDGLQLCPPSWEGDVKTTRSGRVSHSLVIAQMVDVI